MLDVPVRDASAKFIAALREVAAERKIPNFSVVLRVDAADAGSKAVGLVTPEEWVLATAAWLRDEAGAA